MAIVINRNVSSKEVLDAVGSAFARISLPVVEERIWKHVLTAADRESLKAGSSPRQIVTFYASKRKISIHRAILDIAVEVSVIGVARHRQLIALGETAAPRPRWNAANGELHYGEVLVRTVSRQAKSLGKILGAFEEEGWPPRIANPLPSREDLSKSLRDAVRNLNKKVTVIKFFAHDRGRAVMWDLR